MKTFGKKFRIAVVSYRYSIEVSPTLKNICSYLYDYGFGPVDVFVDRLYRKKDYRAYGANITTLQDKFLDWGPLRNLPRSPAEKKAFQIFLRENLVDYDVVFAAEFLSVAMLHNAGFDLSRVVCLNLEGADFIRHGNDFTIECLPRCAFFIAPSKERADDLQKYLGANLDFEYLPVSLRPVELKGRSHCDELNIIYSGYFAEWAGLLEFLEAYRKSGAYEYSSLLLQGHSMGTDGYLEAIRKDAEIVPRLKIDTSFYEDKDYMDLLAKQDVGVAFYKNLEGTENFTNLIFSSGKIASYLWSGLAVLTNVEAPETKYPPFIYVRDFSEHEIKQGLRYVRDNRKLFCDSAYELASKKYNFDTCIKRIVERVSKLCENRLHATPTGYSTFLSPNKSKEYRPDKNDAPDKGQTYADLVEENSIPKSNVLDDKICPYNNLAYNADAIKPGSEKLYEKNPACTETSENIIQQLREKGLLHTNQPLRLHLGCGEQHLEGYINIDYPPSEHNLIRVKADIYADIKSLNFPSESVDEVRLHHVFEHFNRVTALAMLIKWHKWLKIGGRIHIETPDLIGSAKTLVSNASWKTKMGVARHLAGDQAANWGYHVDHWFGERFERTLGALGFKSIQTWSTSWTKEPYLANVKVTAVKTRGNSLQQQLKAAEKLLWESTVSLEERSKWEVWKKQLHAVLAGDFVASPSNTQTPDVSSVSAAPTILSQNSSRLPLDEIHGFNQRSRNRWVQAKARTVPAGSRVLDVGAGTCPYRSFFKHCDYKTHDFKKYKGIKKGNTTDFGQIDYVSDICKIPVPDNSFDVILCTEVLEHVAEPIEALREMLRIVRPGGRILITAPLGSGLHQLPYHFYGGFSPEWYRYFFDKFGCRVVEVTPNGGFFKLLAQECARVQWTLPQHQHLHGSNVEFIRHLFGEWLPRYLFSLEEECFIDQFTVGYHVEAIKVANAKLLISDSEICQWDKRRMEARLNKNTISPICSKDSTMQAQNSHWPVITMSALGKFGRFGNQLFQYASLRIYAKKYNLRTETPKWIGQRLFGCYDPLIQKKLPLVEVPNKLVPFWEDPTFYAKQPLTSVDLKGYFQYHTKYYVKYKEHLRSLFSPLPEIEAKMRIGLESLCSKGKTLVGLHLRRGDFGHHHHFIAPSQWYKEWLKGFWETLEDPVLFIASDEPEKVVSDFVEYKPVTSAQLGMELAEAPFYPDFYILTQCDAVAISNSTFSFVACMLNKRGKIFARPTLSNRKLIPFDPWNSESNFKNEKVVANESYHEQTDVCTETGSTASSGDSNSFCRKSGTLVSGNEKNRDITVKPKISVLMSVYNGERFVTEALKSIYNQTYQDFEVIIVDDCSTDRTSEILLNLKDSRTCIYKNPENLGLTKSLNIGLKLCRGEYVARMDADDISHPQRFERQIKFLDENPDCLVLGCWYGRIDSDGKILGSKEPPTEYEDTKKQLLIEACVGHGTAIVRRAALVEVGGYNEQYTYAQDYDLWLRLSEVGLIRNLDEYLYLLRSWPGNITTIKLKEQTEFAELAISQALQRRYGNGPIDREVSYGFVKRAITWFNLREYVNCINTLNNTQKMAPNITKRFKGYDLLLALAYFAIGREQQCLTSLRREIQNHNNPAAGKFLSDYFEKNLRMDVQNWCSQNSRHYNLQLVDLEKESCQQRQNNNISEPYVSKQQSEQKGIRQSLARLAVLYQDKGETAPARSNLEKILSTRPDFGWAKDMLPDPARQSSSTESQTDRQKILFYFDRIGNFNETSPAGTVIAVLNFARALQSSNPDIKVHITGDLVRYLEKYESFQVVPLPNAEERGKFLTDYDVVFFATHVRYFQGLTKPSGQIWVLYQHCWEAGDYVSLSHTSDFDIVICLSELHRASLREQHIGNEKLITIPNLIDTNVYSPGYIHRNNHSIMFAGGLHPHKCIHILLDAFRLVRQQVQDAELHIYGDGQMWRGGDDYGNYLKGIKPEGVHFHGYVSNKDMPQIYSKHSILCLPSKLETFPMVIVEAQACGCIPVAHNAGGVTATLADEQTGLLYSPNTPEKLAETIIKAIKIVDADPSVRQKAINFVHNTFSINRAAEYISKLWGRITIAKKINTIRTLLEGNEIEQADFECEKLLQKNPNHPDVQLLHALIMLQQGNEPKANVAIGELLENFPNHLRALNDFGLMAMKAGDTEKALRYLTKAYKFNPWDKDTITNCYALLTTSGKYRDAKMLLLNYLTNVGEDAQVLQLFREIDNLIANTGLGTNVVSQEVLDNRQDVYCRSSTSKPLVSIIMTVYNCAEYIGDAIESVLIQNYPKFELIIINDGSTDSTKEVISRYEDQRIRYFYQENTGMSNALNHAVRQARGQYIMPLDADDMMFPNFIAKHLSEFEKHPDADLVYCDVLLIDENSKPIRIMNKPEYQDRRYLIRDLFRAGHPVVPFRLGIKTTVYDKIGLYDEKLKVGMDYDMMRRFVKAGLKEHHLSEPLHLRRMHADSLSGNQSAQKAKSHFEVIKRFIDTFAYDELFPDVAWDEIAPQMRQLHAKCLAAGTYLTIGQNYVRTKAIECSRIAFDLACSELNDCVKMDPENQGLRQLLQKSKLIRAKYTEAPQQVVSL